MKTPNGIPDVEIEKQNLWKLVSGLQVADQLFQNETYGVFNSGLFGRLYKKNPSAFYTSITPISAELVKYIEDNIGIDQKVLRDMSRARLLEPVFLVTLPDDEELHLLIDGHHRVLRRYQLGIKEVRVIVCREQVTELVWVQKAINP